MNYAASGSMVQDAPSGLFQCLLDGNRSYFFFWMKYERVTLFFDFIELEFDILVLATDYENYAVVSPCYYGLPKTDRKGI